MKIKKIFLLLVTIALVLVMFSIPASDKEKTVWNGVDLSKWDGKTDFSKLKRNGVDFAILRVHSYYVDPNFAEYYDKAVEAGLSVGAYKYMYATTPEEAKKEAEETIAALDGRRLDYPLYLDIEDKCLKELPKKTVTDLSLIELKIFEDAGYNIGIYTGLYFRRDNIDASRLEGYDWWIARWPLCADGKHYKFEDMSPTSDKNPGLEMWQFTAQGDGKYYGVEISDIDLNYCYYDYANNPDLLVSTRPSDYTVPSRVLSYNKTSPMKGKDVSWVQSVLYNYGYRTHVSGVYSEYTKKVVTKFQKDYKLTQNGNVDSATLAKLKELCISFGASYNLYYNDSLGGANIFDGKITSTNYDYFVKYNNFNNNGKIFAGWNLKRTADKKWLAVDGKWYDDKSIGTKKAVLDENNRIQFDNSWLRDGSTYEDLVFYAVWVDSLTPAKTITYNGNTYEIYNKTKTYSEAKKYCELKGAHLATITSDKELNKIAPYLTKDGYYVGATADSKGNYSWTTGEKFSFAPFAVQDEGTYKYLTLKSVEGTVEFNKEKSDAGAKCFVLEKECAHLSKKTVSFSYSTCTKEGYTGDIKCASCSKVLQKGSATKKLAHIYGSYKVTKKATTSAAGTKTKVCSACKKEYKAEIPKIKSVTISKTSYNYTGKEIKPAVTIKDANGNKLSTKYYTVKYSSNKAVGTAKITVTFKDYYSGTKTISFKIVNTTPAQVTGLTYSKRTTTSISLKWNKSTGATYYKVQISKDNGKTWKTLTTTKSLTYTSTGLKKDTVYKYRIIAMDSSKKYSAKASAVSRICTKAK